MSEDDGMAIMTHRTTFSLDAQAISRLKSLSRRWKVSQAEVIRRALEIADKMSFRDAPLKALRAFHLQGGLGAAKADDYLREWSGSRQE
jgi:hypothetical protein